MEHPCDYRAVDLAGDGKVASRMMRVPPGGAWKFHVLQDTVRKRIAACK